MSTNDKYLLLVGKWGTYFVKAEEDGPRDLTNNDVLTLLNSIEKKDDEVKQLKAELHQQRFNNKHNLSVDGVIADKIEFLSTQLKEAETFIEDVTDRIDPKDENLARFHYWGKTILNDLKAKRAPAEIKGEV